MKKIWGFVVEVGLLGLACFVFYRFYQGWFSGRLDMMSVQAYGTYVAGIAAYAAFLFTSNSPLGPIGLMAAIIFGGFAMLFSVLSAPLWFIMSSNSYSAGSPEFWKIVFSAPIYLWLPAGLMEMLRRSG